jgi:DNA polymerase III epsilon subunit-like protein
MTKAKHPRGYFKYTLAGDCETTGIALGCDDPSYNPKTQEKYQAVSWGLIVVETSTLKAVDELYVEIQWDKQYEWSDGAERVHGMSREYLRENGVPMREAVEQIGSLILNYWGPESPVCMLGHNVVSFDLPFLRSALRSQGLNVKFANRHVDTNAIGFATLETYNSDDLFELIGLPVRDPTKHNALVDANNALEVVRRVRAIYNHTIEGE